jgi:hypothetical protein
MHDVRLIVQPRTRSTFDVITSPGAHFITGRVLDFVRRTNAAKAAQVAAYPRAILVVLNWLLTDPSDYVDPLRDEPGPWWRAYVVTQGPRVHLVMGG